MHKFMGGKKDNQLHVIEAQWAVLGRKIIMLRYV